MAQAGSGGTAGVFRLLVTGALTLVASVAEAQPPPRIPVEALFSNPAFSSPDLSDDGLRIAYVQSQGDLRVVIAQSVRDGRPTALAKFDDPQMRPNRLEWANDRRILISAHARDPDSVGMRNRVTRLFGVDSDGRNFGWLGRNWPVHGWRALQSGQQDSLVHLTPQDPQTILIEYWARNEDAPQVMRLDVDSGALTIAEKRQNKMRDWYADNRGAVRAGAATQGNKHQLWARIDAGDDFTLVSEHDEYDWDGLHFSGFHPDPRKLFVSQLHEGRLALFEFDIASRSVGRLVEAHPEVDVSAVETFGSNREVVGVRVTHDRTTRRYFDENLDSDFRQIQETLSRELGVEPEIAPVSESVDGTKLVLEVSADRLPPVYYYFDRSTRRFEKLFEELPQVPARSLAATRRVNFRARDGLAIPAYLTLPVGVDARGLPAVALIHGGPWSRDRIGWDPEVQLLANRGFAVLQINYRGSTGFGKALREAGNREWGQKIQDDISDGVQWLIDQGIADPGRIGIMGTSFGGYATLMGLVRTPGLFRAGVAYAPVTDIETTLANDRWYGSDYGFNRRMIGGEIGDADRLRQSSPLRRADEIRAPLLLGHGEDDQRIHVQESRLMAKALASAAVRFEYMEFPREIHGFALESNRVKWYSRVADFFEENVAVKVTEASARL